MVGRPTADDGAPIPRNDQLGLDPGQVRLQDRVTLETLLYGMIFLIAALTRFWDLGSRALHHDETLHAYYSWLFATGYGYQHHPIMHGPFLFHANALAYLLFGANDYVSRIMPALAGVMLVMLPYLLRGPKHLGRWGALIASGFLLFSPSILYYSRFIRHDIYTLLGVLLLFIAIVRYIERPERRWPVLGGLATGLMITNHEISFVVLFIFVTFLAGAIALRVAPFLLAVAAGALLAFGAAGVGLRLLGIAGLPPIPWQDPSRPEVVRFLFILILHPLVVSGLTISLAASGFALWKLSRRRDPSLGWVDNLLGGAPEGSAAAALWALVRPRSGLATGIRLCGLIFVVLYTSLFTNLMGLGTGTVGAVGYWLGQQGVQRGDQPWFYYLVLMPQYEFVAVALFPVAVTWVAWRRLRARRSGADPDQRFFLRTMLIFWSLLILAVLSWAGEKMPWLVVHVTLPMGLLAASLVGEVVESIERQRGPHGQRIRWDGRMLGLAIIAAAVAAFLLFAWATNGPYVDVAGHLQRSIQPAAAARWWIVYLPFVALAMILALGVVRLGSRQVARVLLVAGPLLLVLAQVHASWRLTYQEGDGARDMLIYNQTTPYVPLVSRELEQLSQELTGGMGLAVWYDNNTQWPFNWYLRNFPNRHSFGNDLPESLNAPVVLIAKDNLTSQKERLLAGYTYQEYPMRWAYPEIETYRRFAIAPELKNPLYQNPGGGGAPPHSLVDVARSGWSSIAGMRQPDEQAKIFRLVAFRELPATVWPYTFRVYVRNDLTQYLDGIRY
ncbi:flippase activity-associated protein Agl23 [Nitrolancea hollandica]|uniref:Glycosyl transferase family protein n=1 Tax=Nitrolancea hollandica Lb TaxID=1129897 RepID=I4EFR6_9BACT|nr:flippase activity-associated protein Agl23 [Nitrolancea hollandica]CCF83528.1 Glycosyl transferase family protein [Nitrolancea hollandica Lb]